MCCYQLVGTDWVELPWANSLRELCEGVGGLQLYAFQNDDVMLTNDAGVIYRVDVLWDDLNEIGYTYPKLVRKVWKWGK